MNGANAKMPTKQCPPHFWVLEESGGGSAKAVCKMCGAETEFHPRRIDGTGLVLNTPSFSQIFGFRGGQPSKRYWAGSDYGGSWDNVVKALEG